MTALPDWLAAFPVRPASEAVDALCESWRFLASAYRPSFNPKCREPKLTRVLKGHVETVTARERGILGMWATEGVTNTVNYETGEIVSERRTDIVYGWNDDRDNASVKLVFEFKKVDRLARSRAAYLGEDGLCRFVEGAYSRYEPVAAMVGILTDPFDNVVPPLQEALLDPTLSPLLRLRLQLGGAPSQCPSQLFEAAHFDTEHDRPSVKEVAGPIRVAHIFLPFAYQAEPTGRRRKKPSRPSRRVRR